MAAATAQTRAFDPAAMQRLLDGRYADVRQEIRTVLRRPDFAPVVGLPTAEYRERVLGWARSLAGEGLTAPGFPERYGGRGDPGANVAVDGFGIPDEVPGAPIGLGEAETGAG